MPILLEYLAEETSASNRRTADRFDAENRELEELTHVVSTHEGLRERIVESARQSANSVISRLPQAEGVWRSTLSALPTKTIEESVRILRHLVDAFEAGERLSRAPRSMWLLAEQLGVSPDPLHELDQCEKQFRELATEARRALEHRTLGWNPSDPDRLAAGLQLSREGKAIKADEARSRFLQPQPQS